MPPPTSGAEYERLCQLNSGKKNWARWGPYLPERQWGTMREDYSDDGDTWNYFTHEQSRSRAYRWGEDGLLGLTDHKCLVCFTIALWNEKDSILKERLFGLTGPEGNHGEDVKEEYFYLDSTPTHSYMKSLYKYPQQAFPYEQLIEENQKRSKEDVEFELHDTKIFDQNEYFDVFVEYAKRDADDILIRIHIENRADKAAKLRLLPTLLFRNTWSWKNKQHSKSIRPKIKQENDENVLRIEHENLQSYLLEINSIDGDDQSSLPEILFTENETNMYKFHHMKNSSPYVKDAFHEYIIHGKKDAINPLHQGTKAALHYRLNFDGKSSKTLNLRLYKNKANSSISPKLSSKEIEQIFSERKREADQFYEQVSQGELTDDQKNITRQAYAGFLFTKQFYHYIVNDWIEGEEKYLMPAFPNKRKSILKNTEWRHARCEDIISVPDKWEYPWLASWDLAFHLFPMAHLDPEFCKNQLLLLTRDWYMHSNGQMMAYELNFDEVNPPVIAWSAWRVYKISAASKEERDKDFLTGMFLKLLINFTWWVNRKDPTNKNLFAGGFMGLDNIGIFDRNQELPEDTTMNQSDGTSWIAFYAVVMMLMAMELAGGIDGQPVNAPFEDMAARFLEHFIDIVNAINNFGGTVNGLWDIEDGFYYDQISSPKMGVKPLKIRSFVGIIPLLAVSVIEGKRIECLPSFKKRLEWILENKNGSRIHITHKKSTQDDDKSSYLLTIPDEEQLRRLLYYLLDEDEFLSDYGLRSLSKYHLEHPFQFDLEEENKGEGEGKTKIFYVPGESNNDMLGGNSNWRGPIWLPLNYLIVEALERYYRYYGSSWKVECPSRSGQMMNLLEVAKEISRRLSKIFERDDEGKRACHGNDSRYQKDPAYRDLLLFYEYFHGDTGKGLGASHQTGWTSIIIKHIEDLASKREER